MSSNLPVKNILIIDDDPDDCYLFSDAVTDISNHYSVTCVNNFIEAISALTLQIPDLIFLDLNMPFKNGFESLAELKQHQLFRQIPVVIFSSSNYPKDIQMAYETGASLYFAKPSSFEELFSALKEILTNDWSNAAAITARHMVNGTYNTFALKP